MTDAPQPEGSPLSLPPVERIAEELERPAADEAGRAAADPRLAAMAEAFVAETLGDEAEGAAARQRRAVDEMGLELQQQAARQSEMLKTPLRQLARHGEEGGPVAKALAALRGRMDDLDPRHHRLEPGRFDRLRRLLPGASSRLQRYFHRFETAQQALEAIIADLQGGRDMLERDNLTLSDDQEAMRATLDQLERQVSLGRLIDERLMAARDEIADDDRRAFVEEELLFPLRQRILDLQQQQAVCQQGVLALEVIIRNNRELMRGVDRAVNVTVSALSVAATVALALANQRLVLDRVESLNATTSETIAGTARALRQQGVDIQTRAASANLDMKALEGAFADVMAAVDDLASYRREALPRLGEQIERLEGLTREGGDAVERLARESGEPAGTGKR
ncbi:toxic anion resistance protein [Halomonas smyrnensis]|uniref:toxic anion resistance protein n=1 Tax=Halomonas smyrnensis TaxID=720605 RepID=UPI00030D69F1|nr:toxic anion resistance protein [Halomonas smyrnensis]